MHYDSSHSRLLKQSAYYRTVAKNGRILEYWFKKEDVSPEYDYHEIQFLTDKSVVSRVVQRWSSLLDFKSLPI